MYGGGGCPCLEKTSTCGRYVSTGGNGFLERVDFDFHGRNASYRRMTGVFDLTLDFEVITSLGVRMDDEDIEVEDADADAGADAGAGADVDVDVEADVDVDVDTDVDLDLGVDVDACFWGVGFDPFRLLLGAFSEVTSGDDCTERYRCFTLCFS